MRNRGPAMRVTTLPTPRPRVRAASDGSSIRRPGQAGSDEVGLLVTRARLRSCRRATDRVVIAERSTRRISVNNAVARPIRRSLAVAHSAAAPR